MSERPVVLLLGLALAGCFWEPETPEAPLPGPPLPLAWSAEGSWGGIVAPEGSLVLYGSRSEQLVSVDPRDGSVTTARPATARRLRAGVYKGQPMIVSFDPWGEEVVALTTGGESLWTHNTTDAVDDAWPVDLDGDADSEVVIGLNGGGGVWALGAGGKALWSDRSIGNVWNVTAGPMDEKTLRVLTTSSKGEVHVFSVTGERVRDVAARCYATGLRLGDQPFVGGSGEDGSVVATLDPSGWITKVSDRRAEPASLALAASVPWIAVSTYSGNVYTLRASTGAIEGVASGQGRAPELAWANHGDSPLLLVAGHAGLKAYRVPQSRALPGPSAPPRTP